MVPKILSVVVASLLFAGLPADAAGIYTKNSPVLQVESRTYDSLIAQSNHTSILEFYAPWCGHCKNLKPAYEKAAKNLEGLAKVAAIDCDDESNKSFCSSMGVQGFPTLKIIQPSTKAGKPRVEDYQGARSTKGIVEAVIDKIPNHVTRVQDKNLEKWLNDANDTAKAVLFTEKGTTSALLRALAIDFLGGINIAQIRNKDAAAVELFGITKFPTLVLLPGGDKSAIVYDGDLKKGPMVEFLSQIVSPNPDPAPKRSKASKKAPKDDKKKATDDSSFSSASSSQKSAEASEAAASGTSVVLEDTGMPTESPEAATAPRGASTPGTMPNIPQPIPTLDTPEELQKACLGSHTTTCVLALLPKSTDPDTILPESATLALVSLAEVASTHFKRQAKLFPFYAVPSTNTAGSTLRGGLGIESQTYLEIIAINGKRGWWRRYSVETYGHIEIEGWIDNIRLGEGDKQKVPDGVLMAKEEIHDEL